MPASSSAEEPVSTQSATFPGTSNNSTKNPLPLPSTCQGSKCVGQCHGLAALAILGQDAKDPIGLQHVEHALAGVDRERLAFTQMQQPGDRIDIAPVRMTPFDRRGAHATAWVKNLTRLDLPAKIEKKALIRNQRTPSPLRRGTPGFAALRPPRRYALGGRLLHLNSTGESSRRQRQHQGRRPSSRPSSSIPRL